MIMIMGSSNIGINYPILKNQKKKKSGLAHPCKIIVMTKFSKFGLPLSSVNNTNQHLAEPLYQRGHVNFPSIASKGYVSSHATCSMECTMEPCMNSNHLIVTCDAT